MIKQINNPGQIVQTGLAVEVDGIRVDYCRIPGKFAYEFTVLLPIYETLEPNLIDAAIDQVISAMCDQSYDHGSEWKETGVRETAIDSRTGEYTATVYFRISVRSDFTLDDLRECF